jgi:hypothetical protein
MSSHAENIRLLAGSFWFRVGIKCGWYTLDECGRLGSGPSSSSDERLGTAPAPNNAPRNDYVS